MALAFSRVVGPDVAGSRRYVVVDVTFDSSYPSNGEAVTANDLGLGRIDSLVPVSSTNVVEWDASASKLVVYASGGGGVSGVVTVAIDGGAGGNHTVTGIATTDTLISVIHHTVTTAAVDDITSQFTISAANTIENAGEATTANDWLVITYSNASDFDAAGDVALAEVQDTTDLQNLVVTCHAMGY